MRWQYFVIIYPHNQSKHLIMRTHPLPLCFAFVHTVINSRADQVGGCFGGNGSEKDCSFNVKCLQKISLWRKMKRRGEGLPESGVFSRDDCGFAWLNYSAFDVHKSSETCMDACAQTHTYTHRDSKTVVARREALRFWFCE